MRARGSITFPFSCHAVEFSPFDEDRVAVATAQHFGLVGNGRLHVVHRTAVSGELSEIRNFDTQAGLNDCAWSECHPRQLVTAGADGAVKLWDLATTDGFPVADWREHAQDVSGVDWNLISKDAFSSASWDGTVRLWHPGTPSSTRTFPDHGRHPVYGAVWCPFSASQLLSSSGDGTARVLDINAPSATVVQLNGHGGHEVLTADWDKYSRPVVATGCADGAVRTWDLRRPSHPLAVMLHHRYAVKRVRCSTHPTPAGLVASASYDMSFVLWNSHVNPKGDDASSGIERCVGHTEFVTGLAFSFSDPRLLATCALDRRLCFWSTA